jgi:hypothetical protein
LPHILLFRIFLFNTFFIIREADSQTENAWIAESLSDSQVLASPLAL